MAQIQINHRPRKTWIAALAITAGIGIAVAWRFSGPAALTASSAIAQASTSGAEAPAPTAAPAAATVSPVVVSEAIAQQAAATRVIEQQPEVQAIEGPVTEKPAFVSQMEWAMLQGVANQHATPDKELTRLVNYLRFTKQLELWQDMPKTADAQKRQTLATQLLQDLPQRLTHEEMDLPALQKLQTALLNDAEPDAARRKVRAQAEAKRLVLPPMTAKAAS